MKKKTRFAFNAYLQQLARLNGVEVEELSSKFTVEPSVQQTLEDQIQQSAAFLTVINITPVTEQSGQLLGLGVGSTIAGTTDTTTKEREPTDPTLMEDVEYKCEQTNFDTVLTYAKLDLWAKFQDFQVRIRNAIVKRQALDRIMIAVGIGGAVVRLGNLFNSEIFGMATTLPWGFEFVRSAKWVNEFAPAAVHPTQIYEALCYLATFGLLCWLYYAKDMARRRPGILFGIGLIGIFLTRFFIEFIKTEQEAFEQGWVLDMGQWLSIPFIVLGIYMIYRGLSEPEVTPAPVPKAPAVTPKKKKR